MRVDDCLNRMMLKALRQFPRRFAYLYVETPNTALRCTRSKSKSKIKSRKSGDAEVVLDRFLCMLSYTDRRGGIYWFAYLRAQPAMIRVINHETDNVYSLSDARSQPAVFAADAHPPHRHLPSRLPLDSRRFGWPRRPAESIRCADSGTCR